MSASKTSKVRLFPALMAVSFGVLTLKAVEIADAAAASEEEEGEEQNVIRIDATQPIEPEGDAAVDETPQEVGACDIGPDFAAETGLSQYEIQVLRSLADRRQALDDREDDLKLRAQMAEAAETRVSDQIEELKALEGDLQAVLDAMTAKRDERLDGLVKVYETMKPKDAARIFDTLDDDVLLEMSQRMKHANLAAVMASMSSKRAEELTRLLASQAELPASVDDLNREAG
ncbi:MAG: hypothetical protein AAF719_01780 [Pseudomonadota bacterium]